MTRTGLAATAGCMLSLVAGCASLPAIGPFGAATPGGETATSLQEGRRLPVRFRAEVPKDRITSDTRALAAEGLRALQAGKLEDASTLFNTALRLDLANANLQFMNAFTYHLMAIGGDAQKFDLAEQGYGLAYKFDPTNAAPLYYQGLAFLDQRKYADAKAALAQAATMDESDAEMLYDLARAAYLSGDPRMAAAALRKLSGMKQSTVDRGKLLRAAVVTNAALGDERSAHAQLDEFRALKTSPETADYLAKRVIEWQRVLADSAATAPAAAKAEAPKPELLAQALPRSSGVPTIPGATPRPPAPGTPAPGSGPGAPQLAPGLAPAPGTPLRGDAASGEMAVVDVVLVGTQEDVNDTKGMNLLSGLNLQFGDPLTRQPGFSVAKNIVDDRSNANSDTATRTFTRLISIPAVQYSLNIFNTLTGRNEILARPSLVALANERSEFFSGVDVIAAAVSGGDGAPVSISKQIGVKLSVVPEFLPGDRIKLKVEAERTFITTPSRSVVFNFRMDTSKTTLNANVVMKFGETLVLGGLTEKESENTRDAVPLLGDLPIIQYIFARQGVREYRKSVLILLTPRRAQYANQGEADRLAAEAKLSDLERLITRFEERNRNWFVPRTVLAETVAASESNALFQEYKTGDFQLERWNTRDTHEKRLDNIKNFLFF